MREFTIMMDNHNKHPLPENVLYEAINGSSPGVFCVAVQIGIELQWGSGRAAAITNGQSLRQALLRCLYFWAASVRSRA